MYFPRFLVNAFYHCRMVGRNYTHTQGTFVTGWERAEGSKKDRGHPRTRGVLVCLPCWSPPFFVDSSKPTPALPVREIDALSAATSVVRPWLWKAQVRAGGRPSQCGATLAGFVTTSVARFSGASLTA